MSKKILIQRSRIVAFPIAFSTSAPQLKNYILSFAFRNYSTLAIQPRSLENLKLNPWFITGFTDGEACFCMSIPKNKTLKVGRQVQLYFQISLHKKDLALLEEIKKYFGVGVIYIRQGESVLFIVTSRIDLKLIIEHFENFPLITDKGADFELFKKALKLLELKEHLTIEGLKKLVALKASMNWGLGDDLKVTFTQILPVNRPLVKNKKIQDPHWVAGFTSAEGSFLISINKNKGSKYGLQVQLEFIITQHCKDEQLMVEFIKFFDCGYLKKKFFRPEEINFRVTKFQDIYDKIIPFFKKYPILGVKALDFSDFCKVAEMIKEKKHLTKEGLERIKKIKQGMNQGRKIPFFK